MSPFLLTCCFAQRNAVKFFKKGDKNVEAVLQRLDRLTQDEARTAAAQTLEVVHGLVQNMRVVMDGEKARLYLNPSSNEYLDGKVSVNSVREALGTFCWRQRASSVSDCGIETLHQMTSEKNKAKRQLFLTVTIVEKITKTSTVPIGDQLRRDIRSWLSPPDP